MEVDYMTVLGYILTVTGSVAFIPQIYVVLRSKSGEGIDLIMFSIVDFVTALISAFCIKSGLDASNWLELLITNLQVFTIHALARYYLHQPRHLTVLISLKLLYLAVLTAADITWVKLAMNCLLPVMLFDRGGAVYRNYRDKSTGQLSGVTLSLQWLQFSGRIFTSVVGGAEADFIAPMILSWFFATVVLTQWYIYKPAKEEKTE